MNKKLLFSVTVLPIMMLASCKSSIVGTVTIRDVQYDPEAKLITWRMATTNLAEVKNYTVSINGEVKATQAANSAIGRYSYDAEGLDFEFHVKCDDNLKKHAEFKTTFQNLGTVSNLAMDSGKIVWDEAQGVDSYQVKNNGSIVAIVDQASYDVNPGRFNVQVKPYLRNGVDANGNSSFYGTWSNAFAGTLLDTPKNLKFDSEKISWNAVAGAVKYELTVNGDVTETTATYMDFAGHQEDLAIAVKAVGNGQSLYDSAPTTTEEYHYIAPVDDTIHVEDGNVVWDAPAGATRYKVRINDVTQSETLTTNKYTGLVAGRETRISILPMSNDDHSYSKWSHELVVTILAAPEIRYQNNIISWNAITGAGGYDVKIVRPNGNVEQQTVSASTLVFDDPYALTGVHEIQVKANGIPDTNFYSSKFSNTLKLDRLGKPGHIEMSKRPTVAKQVTLSWAAVTRATSYDVYADGTRIGGTTSTSYDVDVNALSASDQQNDIVFQVRAIGGTATNPIALDSNERIEFNATKLATPENIRATGSQLLWDDVAGASEYVITIDNSENRQTVNTAFYDLRTLTAGAHKIYVQANAGGNNVIPSKYSQEFTVTKLAKPVASINHTGTTDEDIRFFVQWQEINHATNYTVKVGDELKNSSVNFVNLTNNEDYFTPAKGVQVSVMALGDGEHYIDSDYSNTVTILRHATPSVPRLVNGSTLAWEGTNVDSTRPTNFILELENLNNSTDPLTNRKYNNPGSTFSLSDLPGGDYRIRVKAHGNYNDGTIDSPYSSWFTFKKLGTLTASDITRSGSIISWTPIAGCHEYRVQLSSQAQPFVTELTQVDISNIFTEAGAKTITITALGDGNTTADGNPYQFAQQVEPLLQPRLVTSLDGTTVGQFTISQSGQNVTITVQGGDNVTQYNFITGGTDHKQESNVFVYQLTEHNIAYNIQVQILGKKFGSNGTYYIDSEKSAKAQVIWEA